MHHTVFKFIIGFAGFWLCFCSLTPAQTPTNATFSSPPDSLFNEAGYHFGEDVPYIYSLKELNITFEETDGAVVAVLKYHVRLKVFDASVPQASVIGIPYYEQNDIETITSIHAVTWNSATDSTALGEGAIRTIDIDARYNLKEFTMPNVRDGSVLEYSYQIRRRYIEELPAFYLANQVPTVLAKVTITYPQYLRYDAIIQDFDYEVRHEEVKTPVYDAPEIFTNPQPDPILKEVWTARNIPAVKNEKFISTLSDYRGNIKFQLSEFGIPRQPLENSWKFVVEEIRQKQQLFETINGNKKAFQMGQSIRNAVSTKEAAQDSIFQYLLKKVQYNQKNMPFSPVQGEEVLSGEKTNQAAINQTLVSMLRGAAIEAYPVLISTRKSGKINKGYPSFFQFNGQLVWAKIGNKTTLMDASFNYSEPGLIPVEAYNQTGLLLKDNSYKWIEINPPKSVFSIQVNMEAELRRDGSLAGHINSTYLGYPARQIRLNKAKGMAMATIVEELLFGSYLNVQLANVELLQTSSNQPIQITADFVLPDYATVFSSGLRFRPMVVGYLMQNPFDGSRRELPITLDAPEKLNFNYTITLPEGYLFSEKVNNKSIELAGAVLAEHYNIDGNTVQYQFQIDINQKQFSNKLYPQLLNLYERWVQLSRMRWFVQ